MAPRADATGIEFMKDRLYWLSTSQTDIFIDTENVVGFNIDDTLVYDPFVSDFGPVDLCMTYRYIVMLDAKLAEAKRGGKATVHICAMSSEKRANAAFLICAYMVAVHRQTPEDAFEPFRRAGTSFAAFRDASRSGCRFPLTILDCLRGLEAGIRLGWFDWKTFDVNDYTHHQMVENGDMNWIIPNKFLALAGPVDRGPDCHQGPELTPAELIPTFRAKSIELVVRLNSKQYNEDVFKVNNIMHADLVFKDGSCPPQSVVNTFLHITEAIGGAIAVHCRAGLGRTGTLIGLYSMKHYGITAREFIAWSRLCRPGSILGPQQQFLCDMQQEMFRLGRFLGPPLSPLSLGSPTEKKKDMCRLRERIEEARNFTDDGQGEQLVRSRRDGLGADALRAMSAPEACGDALRTQSVPRKIRGARLSRKFAYRAPQVFGAIDF